MSKKNKTIVIFSATRHLFETTILWEIEYLKEKYNIVVLMEYRDIPKISGVDNVSFYRPDFIVKSQKIFRGFLASNYYKKLSRKIQDMYKPDVIIIHQDLEFYTNLFVENLNRKGLMRVILRRPSAVIAPQNDFRWECKFLSEYILIALIKNFITKVYFNILLSFLTTGKWNITRSKFFKTHNKSWANRSTRMYNISLCYSTPCKKYLETIFEDSKVIYNPLLMEYLIKSKSVNKKSVLFIASNDVESVMSKYKLSFKEASSLINKKIENIAKLFIDSGFKFHIRFKYKNDIFVFDKSIRKNIRVVENYNNLYMQILDYECIAAFTSTPLWLLSINNVDRKMFSFQLIDSEIYNYFQQFNNINFIDENNFKNFKIEDFIKKESSITHTSFSKYSIEDYV